jgi:hypothetical protein
MKKVSLVTAVLLAFAVSANAQPGPSDGVWAVDNVQNCKVPSKVYWITVRDGKIRFENVATGSLDIEEVLAAGDGTVMTSTTQSRRVNGGHGHDVGTQWAYHTITSDLINVESNGKHAYWIVKCDDGSGKNQSENASGIGFVNSLDLTCKGDNCVFNNRSGATCASGWSIAVFDSPQGRFIGWLAVSTGTPESDYTDKPLVYKRWRERSRDGFTYLRGIEGVDEKDSWSKLFMPGDNKENLPVRPICG